MKMKLRFLIQDDIGSSIFLDGADQFKIMLDCGVTHEGNEIIIPHLPGGVKHLFLSHAHLDHVAALPFLLKYSEPEIYATPPTLACIEFLLLDQWNLLKRCDLECNMKLTDDDMSSFLKKFHKLKHAIEPYQHIDILPELRIQFIPAGHILGACSMNIWLQDKTIVYTGDFCTYNTNYLAPAKTEYLIRNPDILICESTYGNINQHIDNFKDQNLAMLEVIKQAIEDDAPVLIPAYALQRVEEVFVRLVREIHSGRLPKIPIYTDGRLATNVLSIFRKFTVPSYNVDPDLSIGLSKTGNVTDIFDDTFITSLSKTNNIDKCMLINEGAGVWIVPAGALQGGLSPLYLSEIASNPNAHLIFVGFQFPNSLGEAISKGSRHVQLPTFDGRIEDRKIDCQVHMFHLSAHVHTAQLIEFVRGSGAATVFFQHGTPRGINTLVHIRYGMDTESFRPIDMDIPMDETNDQSPNILYLQQKQKALKMLDLRYYNRFNSFLKELDIITLTPQDVDDLVEKAVNYTKGRQMAKTRRSQQAKGNYYQTTSGSKSNKDREYRKPRGKKSKFNPID
jgi:Cft2 family RNA processing exonuclease